MRILIVTGGTGGHIYPGIAVASHLAEKSWDVFFVGPKKEQVKEIIENEGFKFFSISGMGMPRRISIKFFVFFFKLIIGFSQTLILLIKIKPDLIMGIGGYICPPVILTAKFFRIPTIIHEPNYLVGLANRFLSRVADKVVIGFPESAKFFSSKNIIYTGVPVRKEILAADKNAARSRLKINKDIFCILIFGGSQGTHNINVVAIEMLSFLKGWENKIQFIHITGNNDYSFVEEQYRLNGFVSYVAPYMKDIANAYVLADLIISRSGAVTVSEIIAQSKPSILIPFPHATAGHQKINAEYLSNRGAAILIKDAELKKSFLAEIVLDLVSNKEKLDQMAASFKEIKKTDAVKEIVKVIDSLV